MGRIKSLDRSLQSQVRYSIYNNLLVVHTHIIMRRRTYSYTSAWSDPEELLHSARQSAKSIQQFGHKVVDGLWEILGKSQQWMQSSEVEHVNVASGRNLEMEAQIVMVIRASVVLEASRARVG